MQHSNMYNGVNPIDYECHSCYCNCNSMFKYTRTLIAIIRNVHNGRITNRDFQIGSAPFNNKIEIVHIEFLSKFIAQFHSNHIFVIGNRLQYAYRWTPSHLHNA